MSGIDEELNNGINAIIVACDNKFRRVLLIAQNRAPSRWGRGIQSLVAANCSTVYLDGSFITDITTPNDYDACWEVVGVSVALLDPILLEFSNLKAAQKAKYLGEFFPASGRAELSSPFRT